VNGSSWTTSQHESRVADGAIGWVLIQIPVCYASQATAARPGRKRVQMESDRRAWLREFHVQLTKQLIMNAEHYAAARAVGVQRAGGNIDDLYSRELVQDVLTDTLSGVLAWNPSRCTLETQVLDSVRFRSRHDRVRARRFQHISLEGCDEPTRASIEDALATASAQEPEDSERHAHCLESIRRAAASDRDLTALLDAYRRARSKEEVLDATGMSSRQYDNAKKRLARLVQAERRRELKRA
jgi:hypothetical protein